MANRSPYVPVWERDFCYEIGSVPWSKVQETRRFMDLYDRVVHQWDDSAVQEAFNNAKSRYLADLNCVSCDLPLPDPNLYIDHVDWDAQVDTDLILDLERDRRTEEGDEHVAADGNVGTGKPENSWDDHHSNGWNQDSWGRKDKPGVWDWEHNNNDNSFKTESSWDYKNDNSFIYMMVENWYKDYVGTGKPENSWDDHHSYGWNQDCWGRKERPGVWEHNNDYGFKTESSWDIDSNSFIYMMVENWYNDYLESESREWTTRGAVPRGEDWVEDCQ